MIWPQYERHREQLLQAQRDYAAVIDERRELFQHTQPSAIDPSKDTVSGNAGSGTDKVDNYLIRSERLQLDDRIQEAGSIVEGYRKLLETDGRMLALSGDTEDQVYEARFIKGFRVKRVAAIADITEGQVARIIKKIRSSRKGQEGQKA